jgi:hypothetical protein
LIPKILPGIGVLIPNIPKTIFPSTLNNPGRPTREHIRRIGINLGLIGSAILRNKMFLTIRFNADHTLAGHYVLFGYVLFERAYVIPVNRFDT